MLSDSKYSSQNTQMNRVVYSQLAVATVGGTANHPMKQYEVDENGYRTWNTLCEWYDGDAVKNKTSYSLRSKLESYHLTLVSNAEQHINNFLTSFRELNKVHREAISESHTLSFFPRGD